MTYQLRYNEIKIKKAIGGIAVFNGVDTIYINQDLEKYPKLLQKILDHEMQHYKDVKKEKNALHSLKNLIKTEFQDSKDRKKNFQLLIFSIKHPRAFLPYMRYKNLKIIVGNQFLVFISIIAILTFITAIYMIIIS